MITADPYRGITGNTCGSEKENEYPYSTLYVAVLGSAVKITARSFSTAKDAIRATLPAEWVLRFRAVSNEVTEVVGPDCNIIGHVFPIKYPSELDKLLHMGAASIIR